MRIAILTLPLHTNFGGILQCYALQTVLERMGHEVCVLMERIPLIIRVRLYITRWIKTYILRKEVKYYGGKTEAEIIGQNVYPFINKNIHINYFSKFSSLHEKDFDAIVVGSDQIWRPKYYQPITRAYLDFAKDWKCIKRIAYAASFGTDIWEYSSKETIECSNLVKLFNIVSVREITGVDLCRKYLNVGSVHVLDPTMLLSAKDYLDLIENKEFPSCENGLLCYFLDETLEKLNFARKLSVDKNLKLFRVNNPNADKLKEPFENRIQLSVEQWITGFYNADFVVTDSFHGCVFSILFNKPFIIIGNMDRGMARFTSLLSLLHLENRLVMLDEMKNMNIKEQSIPWKLVNSILEKERKKAFDILNFIE